MKLKIKSTITIIILLIIGFASFQNLQASTLFRYEVKCRHSVTGNQSHFIIKATSFEKAMDFAVIKAGKYWNEKNSTKIFVVSAFRIETYPNPS